VERSLLQLALDLVEPRQHPPQLGVVENIGRAQCTGMSPRPRDVLGRETPVEVDRRIQPLEKRIGWIAKPAHQ
jgi:hypothetical protein